VEAHSPALAALEEGAAVGRGQGEVEQPQVAGGLKPWSIRPSRPVAASQRALP
jgi:hypothetical protein